MNLEFDSALLSRVLLVSIRVGAVLTLTPLFAVGQVPLRIRVLFGVGLGFFLVLAVPGASSAAPTTTGALVEAACLELVTGGVLAFGISAAFAAFQFGGRILDFQLGFGVASLIDPATRTQAPLLGTLLNMTAVTTFFLLGGHRWLVLGLARSLEQVPPGQSLVGFDPGALVAQFGVTFSLGLAVVAPAVLALLLVDTGMAVAARTMPQVNMFILGIPIKVGVGLSVLATSLGYAGPLLERIYTSMFGFWEGVLG